VETYGQVIAGLRQAYGSDAAAQRDGRPKEAFKVDERRRFLDLLRDRDAASLLEVGAGPGDDSLYFQEQGQQVLCTDLSPAMVGRCRAKGLSARVADFLTLGVPPASFDAVYALNCLLHVPSLDLPRVLESIGQVLVPGGLFYAGTWGGADEEGPMRDDHHPVPRFFAFRSDQRMSQALAERFHVLSFRTFDSDGQHFQSFVLENPAAAFPQAQNPAPAQGCLGAKNTADSSDLCAETVAPMTENAHIWRSDPGPGRSGPVAGRGSADAGGNQARDQFLGPSGLRAFSLLYGRG
jgi:SAM-dependent methyltransferase